MKVSSLSIKIVSTLALLTLVAACSDSEGAPEAPPVPPPSAVGVIEAIPEQLPITNELPGRIAPTRTAQVRPRVSGIVVERVFEQGSQVKQGDVLYRIDQAPLRLHEQSAQASLDRALAVQLQARQEAERQGQLRERNIASVQQSQNAAALLAQADADVSLAQVALSQAELDLQYADVTAPIGGRIGRALITEGALVSANGTENLAVIQQLDPVYADFTQPSNELMRLRKALEDGALDSPAPGEASVRLQLDDGSDYPHAGRLLFSEAAVDETTGQVTLRAEIPNPDGDLLPGMYVRVVIEQGVERGALAVPQQAVQRDSAGLSQLYIVGADNVVELRTVHVARSLGTRYVIDQGLKAGDRVVVEGVQKIRAGSPVAPEAWVATDAAATPVTASVAN